ncbi:MAG TPA: type I-U CRISPR-associated protein Csb2, partial [Candidatus Synoicihabitans sp.]|nr:type I-U CRISPR-associated protein Csb2 [Candidatus Synoicihabitans sp.]
MPEHLCISIRFLDGAFHGRAEQGEPEWPPSPLRLYQALVAAAAARWNERGDVRHAAPMLQWFETLPAPCIVAPASARQAATGYRLYVPDNIGDIVGSAWSRGREASIADYRTEKLVRPMTFEQEAAVHYLWPVAGADAKFSEHRETLFTAVRSVTHLGWGVDLVVAEASIVTESDATALTGRRWSPSDLGGHPLRVPSAGTFADLEHRHRAFLNRINGDAFSPVPPLAAFGISNYRSGAEPPPRPTAVFALRQLDDSGYRPFDPIRRGLHVAGMLRHAASRPEFARGMGWSDEETRQLVLGHAETKGETDHRPVASGRLAFLPLPSIEWRGAEQEFVVGGVRRVLVCILGSEASSVFSEFAQRFNGQELVDEKTSAPVALVTRQP